LDKYLGPAFEARGDPVLDWSKPTLKFKISGPIDGAQDSMLGKIIEVDDPEMPF